MPSGCHVTASETHRTGIVNAEMKRLSCCNTLQPTTTHCNTLQHTATHLRHAVRVPRGSLGNASYQECKCGNETPLTLQHTATHCNTLQHTATHLRHAVRVPRDSLGNAWYWKCKCGNETSLLHAHRRARRHSIQSVYQGFRCVCCSVCCIVLQRVAPCCSVLLQCVAMHRHRLSFMPIAGHEGIVCKVCIETSGVYLHGSFAYLQGSFAYLQGSFAYLQGSCAYLQGSFAYLQDSFVHLICICTEVFIYTKCASRTSVFWKVQGSLLGSFV